MQTIFESCQPRDEVLRGELREQQFAASLTKVLRGKADAVYGDPATFFASTYATSGLKSLLREGLGRNLLFLVADEEQVDRMVDVAQQYLAIRRITADPERMREFNKAQAEKLKQMGTARPSERMSRAASLPMPSTRMNSRTSALTPWSWH
jgi:hypothetical protein